MKYKTVEIQGMRVFYRECGSHDQPVMVPTAIHPGGSIGLHTQSSGDDLNYILSGEGKAICDDVEEELKPGVMHICPKGSEHTIINTGKEDLVMLTVVVAGT